MPETYINLEKFIREWAKKNGYFENGEFRMVTSDLICDLKCDIEESTFNPINKTNNGWEDEYDEWYDDFAYSEILPLLLINGAENEEDDDADDFIFAWVQRYCNPMLTIKSPRLKEDEYDSNFAIFKSKYEERFFLFDVEKEEFRFQELKFIRRPYENQ